MTRSETVTRAPARGDFNPVESKDWRPMCAVCGKRVDRITWWIESEADALIAEVACHGQLDHATIPRSMLEGALVEIAVGQAFSTARLSGRAP